MMEISKEKERNNMKQKINKVLMQSGVRPSYKGYPYLVHVILLASESNVPVTMLELYARTAMEYKVSKSMVQHDIRTVIGIFEATGQKAKLEKIVGYPIYEKLTVKEFVYTIVEYINRGI